MSWAVGFDSNWGRDVGYGVPATCDQPGCGAKIDRGLGYVCGGQPYGGDHGCGLYFCGRHLDETVPSRCERCYNDEPPFDPSLDVSEWTAHKLTDPSWAQWRAEHAAEIHEMTKVASHA